MPSNKIVLDTNCLLVSISKYGEAYPVWRGFLDGRYTLCVSTEILEEYEEIIGSMTTPEIARNVVDAILKRKNVERIDPYFHWNLITAAPDDKGGAARLPSVSWRVPVRGLRLCRWSHLHRVGRFSFQRPARHHIPPTAGAQAERVSGDVAEGGQINVERNHK